MSLYNWWIWTCRGAAAVCLLQAAEYIYLRKNLAKSFSQAKHGQWPLGLNLAQLIFGIVAFFLPSTWTLGALTLVHLSRLVQFRGSFNGASDAMLLQILLVGFVGSLGIPVATKAAFLYLLVQICFSYGISGLVKIRNTEWRKGIALPAFLASPQYEPSRLAIFLVGTPFTMRILSWWVIFFEVSFPIVLVVPGAAPYFMVIGIIFHSLVAYFFGLNRFLWVWLTAYITIFHWTISR